MKSKFRNKLTDNIGLKIIALVVAALIWLLVTNNNNPTKSMLFTNVPIKVVNQDSVADIGKVAELEGSGTVTIKVKERRKVLDRLAKNGSDFYIEADLENITDMNTVPLTVTCSNPSITWDEIEISPSSLKVTLEEKVEQAFVISVSTSGIQAAGYEVGTTEVVQGKSIYIAGPASLMKIINQVVAPVNVTGLSSQQTLSSALRVYDKNGAQLTESQMSTLEFKDTSGVVLKDRSVDVNVSMWKIQTDIEVYVKTTGVPAFGYRVAGIDTVPVTISLAGTEEALAALGGKLTVEDRISVAGASSDVSQEIDLNKTLSDMTGLKLITDADPIITAEVQIEKTGDVTLDIPISSVDLVNRPVEMNLVFTPADKISVGIHAENGDASALSAEDIKVSVDLLVCQKEGNYEIPVKVELPDGYQLVSEVTIMVSSEKQVPETETESETQKRSDSNG